MSVRIESTFFSKHARALVGSFIAATSLAYGCKVSPQTTAQSSPNTSGTAANTGMTGSGAAGSGVTGAAGAGNTVPAGANQGVSASGFGTPSSGSPVNQTTTSMPGQTSNQGTGGSAATSFQIHCASGQNLSGNYGDNQSMCAALSGMQNVCAEAAAYYQGNCNGAGNQNQYGSTNGNANGNSNFSSSQVQNPSGGGGNNAGGATSFNVDCPNGSNYNGSYPDHQTMCQNLAGKMGSCPAQVQAQLDALGC